MKNRYNSSKTTHTIDDLLKQIPFGWHNLVRDGLEEMFAVGWLGEVTQIKEKFGSLRLYVNTQTKEGFSSAAVDDIVERMETATQNICCVCGEPKTWTSKGWVMFFCDDHSPDNFRNS
jgi:hypothetical protein